MNTPFDKEMNVAQVAWRKQHVKTAKHGRQNGKQRPWILPETRWEDGFWQKATLTLPWP